MASTKDFADYVTETLKLKTSEDYSLRTMMGEYLVYAGGIYFAGVFDNRFLVKKTSSNEKFGLPEQLPYDGAKLMYAVDPECEEIEEIVRNAVSDLSKTPKKCKTKK